MRASAVSCDRFRLAAKRGMCIYAQPTVHGQFLANYVTSLVGAKKHDRSDRRLTRLCRSHYASPAENEGVNVTVRDAAMGLAMRFVKRNSSSRPYTLAYPVSRIHDHSRSPYFHRKERSQR